MNKTIIRPRLLRTLLSNAVIGIPIIGVFFLTYTFLSGDPFELGSIIRSMIIPIAAHLVGLALGFNVHVERMSITLSRDGIEGPKRKLFSSSGRLFIRYSEIEEVIHVNHPRWLYTPMIVSKDGTKIVIDWGITNDDFRTILSTLENHYVKVSDYVWQIYPDR